MFSKSPVMFVISIHWLLHQNQSKTVGGTHQSKWRAFQPFQNRNLFKIYKIEFYSAVKFLNTNVLLWEDDLTKCRSPREGDWFRYLPLICSFVMFLHLSFSCCSTKSRVKSILTIFLLVSHTSLTSKFSLPRKCHIASHINLGESTFGYEPYLY
jgi:hypothetical protein